MQNHSAKDKTLNKKEKKLKKTTRRASHRKSHLAALSKPGVRGQMENLRTDWRELSYVQRGDRLIQLLAAGCTIRGLADDLRVDDGTVRRDIKIARLSESDRIAIEAGADAKPLLEAARAQHRVEAANATMKREIIDGTPSDQLCDDLAWFLMKEQPRICCCIGNVEQLISEVQEVLREVDCRGTDKYHLRIRRHLDPAYPLGRAIELAQPEPQSEADEVPLVTAICWLSKLILLLEPLKIVRDAAVEKLKATLLFRLHMLSSTEIQNVAKANTPATLARVLREWPPEKPLYH